MCIRDRLNGKPNCFKLGWKEQFIYILQSESSSKKVCIFESEDLILKNEIKNVPLSCSSFSLNSPCYNEYFKMELFLFRKGYFKMLRNFQRDLFMKNEKKDPIDTPKHGKVKLTSCFHFAKKEF